jgi:hypothetical protein
MSHKSFFLFVVIIKQLAREGERKESTLYSQKQRK